MTNSTSTLAVLLPCLFLACNVAAAATSNHDRVASNRDKISERSDVADSEILPCALSVRFLRGYLPVLTGSIAGRPNQNILLDTGSSPAVLDSAFARTLHLPAVPATLRLAGGKVSVRGVWIPSLQFGPFQRNSVPAIERDLSYLQDEVGIRITAVIGLDVFADASFRLDYRAGRLIFQDSTPSESRGITLTSTDSWPLYSVETEVAGRKLRLLLDTGAQGLVLFDSRVALPALSSGSATTHFASNLGQNISISRLDSLRLSIAGSSLRLSPAVMVRNGEPPRDTDGLLGISIREFRSLSYDHHSRTVYLEPLLP